MRNAHSCLLLLLSIAIHAQRPATMDLMPVPRSLQPQNGAFAITSNLTFGVHTPAPDAILLKAVNRFYQAIGRRTGLGFGQEYITAKDSSRSATVQVQVGTSLLPAVGVDESYALTVATDRIVLSAPTTAGALHGLQTLLQLVERQGNGYLVPNIVVADAPRFPWRGLMIDVSRHFIPIDVLQRNLDAMATVKMNVLHLHLTDDQGFRIESKVFPGLHGAGSHGDYYSQSQMRDLIDHARDRGITIVPEFDMPGHTKSWFAGHPELASAPGPYTPGSPMDASALMGKDGAFSLEAFQSVPLPVMDPTKENTYAFLEKFLAEMAALFPAPYLHIGADENNGAAWRRNPAIASFMQQHGMANTHELQAYFVQRVEGILAANQKQLIGWEEMFSTKLPNTAVVQIWQNPAYLEQALDHGNPVLMSMGLYLDLFMPAYIHYDCPELRGDNPALEAALKGGEAAQWNEIADRYNLETRIWPRAAVIAERLWSPAAVTETEDMYRRLALVSARLDAQGLQHASAYERALRHHASGEEGMALRTLTDVLSPVKGYKKVFARMTQPAANTNQTAPIMEISDIIPVDPETKWAFRAAVRSYLTRNDEASARTIHRHLQRWKQNDQALAEAWGRSAAMERVREHSRQLALVADIGLQAMVGINAGTAPEERWLTTSQAALDAARQVHGETELAIVDEIASLVKRGMVPLPTAYAVY